MHGSERYDNQPVNHASEFEDANQFCFLLVSSWCMAGGFWDGFLQGLVGWKKNILFSSVHVILILKKLKLFDVLSNFVLNRRRQRRRKKETP